jgi:dTDP-4-amino-4,6-dideoxygalactose transaminase
MIPVTKTFFPPYEDYTFYLKQIWESGWLTNRGSLVHKLEEDLVKYLEISNLLYVSNGMTALQISIKALDLSGEIITTPFSYVATTSSIVWEGCKPIFVDIDHYTLCINPDLIEATITEKTSAILATHVYGIPCDVEKIELIAKKYNLRVIYDAAHCFGVQYKGQSILNYGDISTLSFHATKLFHTGEGGGIITRSEELAHKAFYMHNFGHQGQEDFHGLGINGKNSELHAAMGLAVLPYISNIIQQRKEISETYDSLLVNINLERPILPKETIYNYAYYPIIFESEEILKKVKIQLNKHNIFPRRYFYPALNQLNYVTYIACPVAESISKRILCLPLYDDLSLSKVKFVTNQIISVC